MSVCMCVYMIYEVYVHLMIARSMKLRVVYLSCFAV